MISSTYDWQIGTFSLARGKKAYQLTAHCTQRMRLAAKPCRTTQLIFTGIFISQYENASLVYDFHETARSAL
jgi:hypothetical protein